MKKQDPQMLISGLYVIIVIMFLTILALVFFSPSSSCDDLQISYGELGEAYETCVSFAEGCEEDFLDESGEWELMCGKSNVYGEFSLCSKCRDLPENQKFKTTPNPR